MLEICAPPHLNLNFYHVLQADITSYRVAYRVPLRLFADRIDLGP